ncbi:MAG: FMN-binding protein [Wenzhouxiangellaceae bacterium]|nr:FMN-binding protein [Wenzhouxiangellaceae bacterium]
MVFEDSSRIDHGSRRRIAGALPFLVGVLALAAGPAAAQGTYMEPDAFLDQAFSGDVPDAEAIWMSGPAAERVEEILGHPYPSLRIRYWARGGRSAWILDEIGKERPITTGITIDDGRIVGLKVLIFRETRGWEVRYPFFTEQFEGAALGDSGLLDRDIDNITGATLSVNAIRKLARLALYLDQHRLQQARSDDGASP